jgi:hypothetical protein
LRLKNAEQRSLITKLQKGISEQESQKEALIMENTRLNKLREQDISLFKSQDQVITLLTEENTDIRRALEASEEQVMLVRGVLERTVDVKIEYEEVIKELLLCDNMKELVIEICMRNRQQAALSCQE